MYETYIETSGAGLAYYSDIDIKQFLQKEQKLIDFPELKIYDIIPKDCNYFVKYIDSYKKSVVCNDDNIIISYPKKELTPASIVYMGYILMEKQRMEKTMVTIHSACVEKDGNGILLLGRSGSGKTTIATNLCMEKNYNLVGNDRTVIGVSNQKLYAYGGTKFMFFRYESIKRNLPQLLKYFESENQDPWLYKIKVNPMDLGIEESENVSQILQSNIIHIDNNQSYLNVLKADTPANKLYLNELTSMYIRGIYTTFCDRFFNADGYIKSYDNQDYYRKRVSIINNILYNTNFEYISGNVNNVSNYIIHKQKRLIKRKGEN